jgi:hypothetical protein
MALYTDNPGRTNEAEPIGLLTEGAAGIAVIVLTVIALAGIRTDVLASIVAIVIGIGLMVQAFNSAADAVRGMPANATASQQEATFGGEIMVDCLSGLTGIVLGILALVGMNAAHLLPPALIVFGGSLLLGGAIGMRPRHVAVSSGTETRTVTYQGPVAAYGAEVLIGLAAIVLGIVSLMLASGAMLVLVGFLAVGAALLLASASFAGAVLRLFETT